MKRNLLILSIFLCGKLIAQNDCTIRIMTPDSTLTQAEYFLTLGNDKVTSTNGTLIIDKERYKTYRTSEVLVTFSNKVVIRKLYKDFLLVTSKSKLSDLCGKTFFLEHH